MYNILLVNVYVYIYCRMGLILNLYFMLGKPNIIANLVVALVDATVCRKLALWIYYQFAVITCPPVSIHVYTRVLMYNYLLP